MRTAVSKAASLRHLRWQAAFTTKYQTSSPVFWQHVFVSDTPMTNWSGGSSLILNWTAEKGPLEEEGGLSYRSLVISLSTTSNEQGSRRESCPLSRELLNDLEWS
jgi:hypothetical protein